MFDVFNNAAIVSAYSLASSVEPFSLPRPGNSTINIGVPTGNGDYFPRTYTTATGVELIAHAREFGDWLAAHERRVVTTSQTRVG